MRIRSNSGPGFASFGRTCRPSSYTRMWFVFQTASSRKGWDFCDVIPLSVQPADAGFGFMRRSRRYHLLALRGVVALSTLPGLYTRLTDQLAKDVSAWPRWVRRATKEEFECEHATARSCEQLSSRGGTAGRGLWWPRLTPDQQIYIKGYADLWRRKHGSPPEESAACVFDTSLHNP